MCVCLSFGRKARLQQRLTSAPLQQDEDGHEGGQVGEAMRSYQFKAAHIIGVKVLFQAWVWAVSWLCHIQSCRSSSDAMRTPDGLPRV